MSSTLRAVCALLAASIGTGAYASNLIVNGDFESASLVGVNSDYVHTPNGNTDEGQWWLSPWEPAGQWDPTQHTPGGVGAMNVNGDDSALAGITRVWYQQVPVTPGTQYDFSAWMLGTIGGFAGYSLQFAFDGNQIGGVNSPSAARIWEPFNAVFNATGTTVEISVVNVSGITFPNDFMIDDISLVAVPAPGVASLVLLAAATTGRRRRG